LEPPVREVCDWAACHFDDFLRGARTLSRVIHDLSGLAQITLELALRELGAVRGSLMLCDGERRLRIQAARGLPEGVAESTAVPVGEGVAGHVADTKRPLLVEDLHQTVFRPMGSGRYQSASFVSVPLADQRDVLGVLNVTEPVRARTFSRRDLESLTSIADSLGLAIQQAVRFQRAEELAIRDPLTGLYNRRYLWDVLDRILAQAREQMFPVTLVLFDLDHFKQYNDAFGHPAGDRVLTEIAQLMQANFRQRDVVCRIGGEEFAVMLWDTRGSEPADLFQRHPLEAFCFADRLRRTTMHHNFPHQKCRGKTRLTLSGGLATFPWDAETPGELVERADEALYRAKRDGRNRVYLCGTAHRIASRTASQLHTTTCPI
jgi:diguanylate cyclase (GGDEF)-like protein